MPNRRQYVYALGLALLAGCDDLVFPRFSEPVRAAEPFAFLAPFDGREGWEITITEADHATLSVDSPADDPRDLVRAELLKAGATLVEDRSSHPFTTQTWSLDGRALLYSVHPDGDGLRLSLAFLPR